MSRFLDTNRLVAVVLLRSKRPASIAIAGAGLLSCTAAAAQVTLSPSAAFVQIGADADAREVTSGVTWDWSVQRRWAGGHLSGYWEASLSRWTLSNSNETGSRVLSQVGLIPVLRFRPSSGVSPWFFEAGIGLTLMSTLYRSDSKRFSTRFNFGDHLAFGYSFGARREHDLALRIEHFSNGGIREPNPGQNFVQLRYGFRFN